MKILQLVSSLGIGGAERFVTDLCIKQKKEGNEVQLVVLDRASHVGKNSLYEEQMLNELLASNIAVTFVPGKGRKNIIGVYRTLSKVISAFQPDAIHSHLLIWSLFLSLKRKSCSHTYTQHINRLRFPYLHKLFLQYRIDKYISICDEATTSFKEFLPSNKIIKVINGVDIEKFTHFQKREVNTGNIEFITVSRLNSQKNHMLLIEAVSKLTAMDDIPEFRVKIVGDGPLLNECKQLVESNNLGNIVEFMGTRSDVPQLLLDHDVFLLPSNYEGFSIALIEALASGIQIIATDVGGNSEILGYGKYATLIPKKDESALVSAMLEYIQHYEIKKNEIDFQKHLSSLSIEQSACNHIDLYKSLG